MANFTPLTNGQDANAANFNAPLTELSDAIDDVRDGTLAMASPQITSFANAAHDHTDAAGGGLLPFDALDASGASDGDVLQVSSGAVVAAPLSIPSGAPSGAVSMFAGSSAPSGWLLCYGQAVSRTTYADLFTAIGTTYGVGDGSTTFNLPDLRGRVIGGLDNMGGSSANRVTDASADSLGGAMGAETHTLTIAEMPSHSHEVPFLNDNTTGGGLFRATSSGGSTTPLAQPRGGDGAHNNVQPTMFMNYIIKT